MARSSLASHLQRLERLAEALRAGECRTVAELARALAVSPRTVTRDIELLRDRGLPIEADVGRGGGVRLHRGWALGRVSLDYGEVLDVLLSLAVAERLDSPLFLGKLASLRRKLAASFPELQGPQIRQLRRRILIGERTSAVVLGSQRSLARPAARHVQEAFLGMKLLEIAYVDERGRRSHRCIEPQYLLLAWPVWYLLAWDRLREAVRSFRLDRIVSASARFEPFALRGERLFLDAIGGLADRL